MLIGVNGRNQEQWREIDFESVNKMGIQVLKMMSHTSPDVFERLKKDNPDIQFIVRLYWGGAFGKNYHPIPQDFVNQMIAVIRQLRQYTTMFQVHNEPNHLAGIEGWGDTDDHAKSFNVWFLEVYRLLKEKFPDCKFGFPGLAVPHRDLEWLDICAAAINKADWLGCHCYWQNPNIDNGMNHTHDFWGLKFKLYHDKYPNKDLHILEAGNSNHQSGYPSDEETISDELIEWFKRCELADYVKSASPFILSSPDPSWESFSWVAGDGRYKPIVYKVRDLIEEGREDV